MGEVVDIYSRKATEEELKLIFSKYPEAKEALGEDGIIEYDNRTKSFWVIVHEDGEAIDLTLEMFLTFIKTK